MKALDTNILVRFLTSDDPAAFQRVAQLLESAEQRNESFRLTTLVLLELRHRTIFCAQYSVVVAHSSLATMVGVAKI